VNNPPNEKDMYNLVGYDSPLINSDSEDSLNISDIIADEHNVEQDAFNKIEAYKILQLLSERERQIIELKSKDKTDREISELFGVTPQAINKTINNIRRKFRS